MSRSPEARPLHCLDDAAARAEACRLAATAHARWAKHATWFGFTEPDAQPPLEDSPFAVGMLALFRYARGEAVPPFIVRSVLDDLLELLFGGLASPALGLPPWRRMGDRPWALAWRAAELRLLVESEEPVEASVLAHLLGWNRSRLEAELLAVGLAPDGDGQLESARIRGLVQLAYAALLGGGELEGHSLARENDA